VVEVNILELDQSETQSLVRKYGMYSGDILRNNIPEKLYQKLKFNHFM
jgi:hypothetical protein